ncbi:MAG: acyl dehydratase [Lentisphaeria bacterium]
MSVVDFLKEKRQRIQLNQQEFKDKFEPQWREFSDIISQKIDNTLNNPWVTKFYSFTERDRPTLFNVSPEVETLFRIMNATVGEVTHVGQWFDIDQERINRFAEVTEDRQWIHIDTERAKRESPFHTTVAHGFLTLALLPVLTESVSPEKSLYPGARMVVNCGLNRVLFPYPVKPGAQVRATTKLIRVVPHKKNIEIVNEVSVAIKNSPRLACVAETVLRLYV